MLFLVSLFGLQCWIITLINSLLSHSVILIKTFNYESWSWFRFTFSKENDNLLFSIQFGIMEFSSSYEIIYIHFVNHGMLAIGNIKEYRSATKALNCISVDLEFVTLHALLNVYVAVPEDLRQVCTGDQLTNIDKNILHNFVKLRIDYRSSNLERLFTDLIKQC